MTNTYRFTGDRSACPADGAILHALEIAFDADGGYYPTGRCDNCGEQLYAEGERYVPSGPVEHPLEVDWQALMRPMPGRLAWHRRAP